MSDYSISEASQVTGISVRSLRNYLRQYGDFLHPTRGNCNALVFQEEEIRTFLKIRTLLREGRSREEVSRRLSGEVPEHEMVIRRADLAPEAEANQKILEQLDLQRQVLERLVGENLALRERLEVMEVRFGLRHETLSPPLPSSSRRQLPVRRSLRFMEIPLPYFLLRMTDGARAFTAAMAAALFTSRAAKQELRP
jgi:DNA-binding transcriptional MerR regulator